MSNELQITKDIKEAIEEMNESIEELQKYKKVIEKIDLTEKVDEETWHSICETPLRASKSVMTILTRNLFPNAENIKLGVNYVYFDLYGFAVQIPTSRARCINVDMYWWKRPEDTAKEKLIIKNAEKRMEIISEYYKAKERNASWKEKAKIIVKDYKTFYPVGLFKEYLKEKRKFAGLEFEEIAEEYQKIIKENEKKIEKEEEKARNNQEKIKILKEKVMPEINAFSTVHRIYNDVRWSPITVDELLNMDEG